MPSNNKTEVQSKLITPYGGSLIDLLVKEEEKDTLEVLNEKMDHQCKELKIQLGKCMTVLSARRRLRNTLSLIHI